MFLFYRFALFNVLWMIYDNTIYHGETEQKQSTKRVKMYISWPLFGAHRLAGGSKLVVWNGLLVIMLRWFFLGWSLCQGGSACLACHLLRKLAPTRLPITIPHIWDSPLLISYSLNWRESLPAHLDFVSSSSFCLTAGSARWDWKDFWHVFDRSKWPVDSFWWFSFLKAFLPSRLISWAKCEWFNMLEICAGLGILTATAELLSGRSADVAANRENCSFCFSHTMQPTFRSKAVGWPA